MNEGMKCFGYGKYERICSNRIGSEDLELNPSGLWCVRCERLRREAITQQMVVVSGLFPQPSASGSEGGDDADR